MTNEVIENIVETTSTGKTEGFFHFLSSPIVNITALCITFILILGIIVVFVCGTKIKNKLKTEFYELLYKDIYEILLEKADLSEVELKKQMNLLKEGGSNVHFGERVLAIEYTLDWMKTGNVQLNLICVFSEGENVPIVKRKRFIDWDCLPGELTKEIIASGSEKKVCKRLYRKENIE